MNQSQVYFRQLRSTSALRYGRTGRMNGIWNNVRGIGRYPMRAFADAGVFLIAVVTVVSVLCSAPSCAAGNPDAREIMDVSGVEGGIVVHLGCGDGSLTADLRVDERFTVQGLARDRARVLQAREAILDQGLYGPVSIDWFSGPRLPYADNLARLLVVEEAGGVPEREMMRVLAPGGALVRRSDGHWRATVKPYQRDMDDWTHFLHDAGNNAVAKDEVVGPPERLQWIAPPLYLRSHETPSGVQALVTSGSRLFYIFDEGLIGITDPRLPDRWSLVCRDAFSGKLLWKRPLKEWGWREWARGRMEGKDWTRTRGYRVRVPSENQTRLVAGDGRLYATLSYNAPVSVLDSATGKIVAEVEGTRWTDQIRAEDGIGLAYVEEMPAEAARRRGNGENVAAALVAFDGQTGNVLWNKTLDYHVSGLALAVEGGRVFCFTGRQGGTLACIDLQSGETKWTQQDEVSKGAQAVVADGDKVFMAYRKKLAVYRAADGEKSWETKLPYRAYRKALYVVGDVVFPGAAGSPNAVAVGYDVSTGEKVKEIKAKNLTSPEHHHRCYRNKATSRYIIASMEGAEFLAIDDAEHSQNNWVRGACKYGMMPANGLLYVPPDQCFCSPGAMLRGFAALAPAPSSPGVPVADDDRLARGPAWGASLDEEGPRPGDWPTYRHDAARTGSTPVAVSDMSQPGWKTELGGGLTSPVAADGRIYVARVDANTVYALDADSGEEVWRFSAAARIDSPPTLHKGLCLFGAADGRVYCLRAADGKRVWTFTAAPRRRLVGYYGRVESAWPVHGSVLVRDGLAYVTAGRSSYLDQGIHLYGLDPATGKVLHQAHLGDPPLDIRGVRDKSFYTLGANSDVLVAEDGFIYMRQKKFTPDLRQIQGKELSDKGEMDVGLHLFSTSSLLDGSWYNRTFWMYSKRWPGFQLANQAPKSGQLIVRDAKRTFALRMFYLRNAHSPMFFPGNQGYLLFADHNTTEPQIVGEEGARDPVRWLPMSDYSRGGDRTRAIESEAFGRDKGIGYTRAEPPLWKTWLKVRIRAMVKAGDTLYAAGPPDEYDPSQPFAAFQGRKGAVLATVRAEDGRKLSEVKLDCPPVFDGLIAAGGRLYVSMKDGSIRCLSGGAEVARK